MGRGETGEEIREKLETEDQYQPRVELVRNQNMRESVKTLTNIPEEREREEEAEESELKK